MYIEYDDTSQGLNQKPQTRFILKVRYKEGATESIIYEKKLDKMLDCWYLSDNNRLLFMEDLESREITLVNLVGTTTETKTFVLPAEVSVAKRLSHNLESVVQRHPCPDKQLVREFIRR